MINEKIVVIAAVLFFIDTSLVAQEMTNERIVQNAIDYHDPKRLWGMFAGKFIIQSGEAGATELQIDNGSSFALWTEVLKSDDSLSGGYNKDSCIVRLNGKDIPQVGSLENFLLDCENIKGRTNYWVYMYGLPMKLKDEQVHFVGKPEKVSFLDKVHWRIRVNYNPGQSDEYWQFFFDTETFALKVAQFFHPALKGDSEYILYEETKELAGIKIPTKHSWYMYNDKEFIGFEKLVRIK